MHDVRSRLVAVGRVKRCKVFFPSKLSSSHHERVGLPCPPVSHNEATFCLLGIVVDGLTNNVTETCHFSTEEV